MNINIKITNVELITNSNSSYGNYAIPVDFEYTTGGKANTFKYAWRRSEAVKLYNSLKSKIGKTISIYDL